MGAAMRYAKTDEEDMHQWFDMESVQKPCYDPEGIQVAGMRESLAFVGEVIKREAAEVGGFDKVFIGGISQGCATAITALLTVGEPMAGFIGFCGWCPFSETLSDGSSGDLGALLAWLQARLLPEGRPLETASIISSLRTPVLLEHAKDDGVVPVALGQDLHSKLASLGVGVQWREYEDGAHWINEPEGIDDMVKFVVAKASPGQEVL
jgi:lysophospholipase-2